MNVLEKNRSYRVTGQRKIILEEIQKVYIHPTAQEILKLAQKKIPTIGLATIYRVLKFLEREKLIIKIKSKNKEARYDGITNKHCHLICTKCNLITDIMDVKNIKIDSKEIKKSHFKLDLDYVELQGVCEKCR